MPQLPLVLVYVNHTLQAAAPSGIQRVATRIAEHLPAVAAVEFVTWDYADGQLRYLDARALEKLYRGRRWPQGVRPHPQAHRVNYRFGDTLPADCQAWLLMPEVSYHSEAGTEVVSRIISMCRQYGVKTAAVFYDAIPITNPIYRSLKSLHLSYLAQIARCDRIYAISRHSKRELERHYARCINPEDPLLTALSTRIAAIPLAEAAAPAAAVPPNGGVAACNKIVLLGTVEARKGQVRVLKAFRDIGLVHAGQFELHVAGSLHPDVAEEFTALIASSSLFHYHGYVPEADADDLFRGVRFTVFASDDEGFGLPIAESIAHGIPCLAANFGAMAETARGGGCLTVDVRDARRLAAAMTRLMSDDALVARLRDEISARTLRTWRDYAGALATDMQEVDEAEAAAGRRLLASVSAAFESSFADGKIRSYAVPITIADDVPPVQLIIDAGESPEISSRLDAASTEFRVIAGDATRVGSHAREVERAACASAWALTGIDSLRLLVDGAHKADCGHMLPATCIVEPDRQDLIAAASLQTVRQIRSAHGREQVARRERLLGRLAARTPGARDPSLPLLTIVISTYNRARFVQENVRWLLGILDRSHKDISLVVVDNASTDDTLERLAAFAGSSRLTVISNPVNLGMLGNLRACASLILSRYVWITGDDDFILPGGLAEVVEALGDHPEVPFAFVNFGIYHRAALRADETVERLVAERAPLALKPMRSGIYPIARIAEQHDNLFTAFYPIVFRSDLLAACFNYPFDGKPFIDLVESVPTTKMLLETYGSTDAFWCATMGTVGNLNNSWSRHLPRWHAVLMPRVFQLAREVGVDPARLHHWSRIHRDLFEDAKSRALAEGIPLDIAPGELEVSHRIFRQPLSLA